MESDLTLADFFTVPLCDWISNGLKGTQQRTWLCKACGRMTKAVRQPNCPVVEIIEAQGARHG